MYAYIGMHHYRPLSNGRLTCSQVNVKQSSKNWSGCSQHSTLSTGRSRAKVWEETYGEREALTYNGGLGQNPQRSQAAQPLLRKSGGFKAERIFCITTTRGAKQFFLKFVFA